jgi:hypothetical protein
MSDDVKALSTRIGEAIRRVTSGAGVMRIPVDPTDPDVVLADCLAHIDGEAARTDLRVRAVVHRRISHPGRVVFAERPGFEVSGDQVAGSIAMPAARFVSWPSGDEVLSLRPCHHVPGKWRSHHRARVSWLRAHAEKGGRWQGVDARELLVALDAWLEAGCPRRKWKRLTARNN